MPSFKVQVYCNMRVYGSLEVEAASFHEAAQKFAKLPNLKGAEWGESSLEYVVDLITSSDYKFSSDANALGKEVSVELAWSRNDEPPREFGRLLGLSPDCWWGRAGYGMTI